MKKCILLFIVLLPVFSVCQDLTNESILEITKTWSQAQQGYTYPMEIQVPAGEAPSNGFPICILLHGKTQSGGTILGKYGNFLPGHVLIAPTAYQNSWNICSEKSDAPDLEMISDLIVLLEDYSNINSNQIRILGSSNGAQLANRIFIENNDERIDLVCTVVSQLNELQYHSGGFYKPESATNPSSSFCGYTVLANPLNTRKYLSICNSNDQIVPYAGGFSEIAEVEYLNAEKAAYIIAQNQGYSGSQLAGPGTPIGSPAIFEFSYLSGKVIHLNGNAGHDTNFAQKTYIANFFSESITSASLEANNYVKIQVYPNPSSSLVNIERTRSKSTTYSIMNTSGELIFKNIARSRIFQIDLTGLPPNIYFMQIDNQTVKLVKL